MPELSQEELYAIAQFLYGLLDDIDTVSDIAKSDDALYRKLVEKMQQKKSLVGAGNDGHMVVFKPVTLECKLLNDIYTTE